ncbi:hypothetical protein QFZ45_005939 [Pseudomonas synxantha]|nr:hypothetical protein [Pseudomonas synxantha]
MKNMHMFFEVPVLSRAQVAALAKPGDSWADAQERAERLHSCVHECRPCHCCNATGRERWGGWVDDPAIGCPMCALRDRAWPSNPNIYD